MKELIGIATYVALAGLVIWIANMGCPYFIGALVLLALIHGYFRLRQQAPPSTTFDFPPSA